jgi:hypothetical protein
MHSSSTHIFSSRAISDSLNKYKEEVETEKAGKEIDETLKDTAGDVTDTII